MIPSRSRVPSKSVLSSRIWAIVAHATHLRATANFFWVWNVHWNDYTSTMKSAFELAMSRLEKESPTQKLTDEQKRKLAEVDNEIKAKIAEKKLFLEGSSWKASGDPQIPNRIANS